MLADIFSDPFLIEKPVHQGFRLRNTSWNPMETSPAVAGLTSSAQQESEQLLLRKKLLQIDLTSIKQDAAADLNIRKKLGPEAVHLDKKGGGGLLVADFPSEVAADFTRSSWERKVRLVLNEVLRVHHLTSIAPSVPPEKWQWHVYPSELFSPSSCVDIVAGILSALADAFETLIPLSALCHSILHLPHGLWILSHVLKENEEELLNVHEFLLRQSNGDDLDDPAGIFYGKVLAFLARTFPESAMLLRYMAISQQRFFNLVLAITIQEYGFTTAENHDSVKPNTGKLSLDQAVMELFYEVLVAPEAENRLWSSTNTCNALARASPAFEECRLQLLIYAYKILPADSLFLPEDLISAASRVIQVYIHLRESAERRENALTLDEHRVIGKLLTCHTPLSTNGNAFVVLGLCCFTLMPELFVDGTGYGQQEFVDWVKWQLEVDVVTLDQQAPMGGTFMEVLLLLATHLRANQYKEIGEIISEYLHIKVSVKASSVQKMKSILATEIFRDEGLLRHSLRVPPTHNLNAALVSALPVNCIYNLLKNKTFALHNVSIRDWILNQVRKCTLPVHPVMVQVLTLYVQTILPVIKKESFTAGGEYVCPQQPFSAAEVLSIVFDAPVLTKSDIRSLRTVDLFVRSDASDPYFNVPKILIAYYVLAYNDFYMNHLKTFLTAKLPDTQPYGTDVMEKIPFKHYLALTLKYQELYEPLGEILGRLMLQLLPQMRTVFDDIKTSLSVVKDDDESQNRPMQIVPAKLPSPGEPLTRYLDLLTRYPPDRIGSCMDDFLATIQRVLSEDLLPCSQDAFEQVWIQLADIDPNTMLLATTQAFLLHKDKTIPMMTYQELCFEPLHVLRCDPALFRQAFLTRILIRIFASYLIASKTYLTQQLEMIDQQQLLQSSVDAQDTVREERKRAMFMLQESVAVQILIEQCASDDFSDSELQLPLELTDSQNAICTFIHQMIINNPTLAKLIVFQGFPVSTVANVVRGVESLHICFDYLHEAMALPSIEKKLFVLELTSCLCMKFRITRTLAVGKLAVEVIATLLVAYPSSFREEILRVGARCLARLGNVFPPLRDDCVDILDQMIVTEEATRAAGKSWRSVSRNILSGQRQDRGVALLSLLRTAVRVASGQPPLRS